MAQAGQWQEAERIIRSLSDKYRKDKARALRELGTALAQCREYYHLVRLIQQEWLRVTSREEALSFLPLAFSLLAYTPDLGMALLDAFAWVDRFLQG